MTQPGSHGRGNREEAGAARAARSVHPDFFARTMKPIVLRSVNARQDVVSQVVEQFKELLINGSLRPGDRIPPEPVLCEQLGVSRTAVREAIRTLSAVGLVEVRRGNGTFIATAPQEAPLQLLAMAFMLTTTSSGSLIELRQVFESACGELVIRNARPDDFERLDEQVQRFREAVQADESPSVLRRLDLEFHDLLFDATHNPMFARLGKAAMSAFASTMQHALTADGGYAIALADHLEILDALKRRSAADYARVVQRSLATWMGHLGGEPARR